MSEPLHFDLIVLGAGAAGLMAAVAAGETAPRRIAVLEKNARAGIKVLVCGGGRCNFTNAGSVEFLIEQFGRNGRFLTPALHHLDNAALRAWFAAHGVPSHEEHDGKIYPDSNQARSVVDALLRQLHALGVTILAGAGWAAAEVKTVLPEGEGAKQPGAGPAEARFIITTADGHRLTARSVILAVGGQSYTRMGTTGDGYRFAAALGHTVITPRPAIVALLCKEEWPKRLQGLAVPDVEVRIEAPGPLPRLATGKPTPSVNDLLFTHFGVSGPAVLNPSEIVAELLEKFPGGITLRIDFVRHQRHETLAALLHQWQQQQGKKMVKTMLATLIPERLAAALLPLCQVGMEQTCATLTAGQMHGLVERLKGTRLTIYETRGFKEAMVTAGGVKLDEVDPKSMESRRVPGLYLAGEVLDLTGPSGGYNLQLAFSTGHLAGTKAAEG